MYLDKGNFKIGEIYFSYFMSCKKIYIFIYPKVSLETCILKCVKILGKVVKIRVFM
jgi:hypothetical protein